LQLVAFFFLPAAFLREKTQIGPWVRVWSLGVKMDDGGGGGRKAEEEGGRGREKHAKISSRKNQFPDKSIGLLGETPALRPRLPPARVI
jgi:hypothetical protein